MDNSLGLLDSILVALALGSEGVGRRLLAADMIGVDLVTCQSAPASARAVLKRIGRQDLAEQLQLENGRLDLPGVKDVAAAVLPASLEPREFARMLSERNMKLAPRELAAGYQVADLALHGTIDILSADDGCFGHVRATLASVEPFSFLGTGTLATRDGVAALTLTAQPPRGLFLTASA